MRKEKTMEKLIEILSTQNDEVLKSFALALKDSEIEKNKINEGEENHE